MWIKLWITTHCGGKVAFGESEAVRGGLCVAVAEAATRPVV